MLTKLQRLRVPLQALADALLINLAFLIAYWMRYDLQVPKVVAPENWVPYAVFQPVAWVLTLLLLIVFALGGVYHQRRGRSLLDEVYAVLNGTATAIVIVMAATYLIRFYHSRIIFLLVGAVVVGLLGMERLFLRRARAELRKRGHGIRRVVIVGAGEVGRSVMRNIVARPELGYLVVGFVDDNPDKGSTDIGRFKALGGLENLPHIVSREAVDEVIITLPWMYHRKILSIVRQCERHEVRSRIVPDLFQLSLSRVEVEDLAGIPLLGLSGPSVDNWVWWVKRALDFSVGLIGLAMASPLMLVIGLAIKLDTPGPVIFSQTRVGKDGRLFTCYKFRTMRAGADEEKERLARLNEAQGALFKIKDDPRITRIGRLLRRASLDELPQLYNMLKGDMSLVGPRPPLPEEVSQYLEWHKRRLETWPGLTGLWQVSGRSNLTFDEMCLLDIYYVENWSLTLDTKIVLQTIPKVILGDGAY
ncbi:MAG: sugar transferase [Anaerolineae bacterium]|nr:MAG: sugar transferase [Anaerolineae bacterium]